MAKQAGGGYRWGEGSASDWIDISLPFHTNMWHWPTDPPARAERIKDRDKGDPVSLMEIQWVDHTGTHVDAPLHFIAGGKTIDEILDLRKKITASHADEHGQKDPQREKAV